MENLIKALQIFLKYKDVTYPTHCEHDVLYVVGYDRLLFSDTDITALKDLGFEYDDEDETFYSFRYGSA